MLLKNLATAALAVAVTTGAAGVVVAQDGQFIPVLSYRTGPYAPNGTPFANGYVDYFQLINERDGGVNGIKFIVEECETGYKTDRGVECYDRLKDKHGGATVISPWSTGTTYALIDKATNDKIPILSMGYGRTSAADGRVFPYVFNFPATYWSQATAVVQYIANELGGLDALKGKEFGFIYLDHPYGREPIPTFDILAEKFGFSYTKYAVPPTTMTEQKSIWLQIRRTKPAYVIMWGWGAMNSTAIKEAANIRFQMDRFIGNWWSAAEPDVLPAGDGSIGYKGATFNGAGLDYKVFETMEGVDGLSSNDDRGTVLYNRGLVNAAYIVEAVRLAQEKYGEGKRVTGEQVRWALENLDLSAADVETLGLSGLLPPTTVTCLNHEGTAPAILIQQWNGKAWEITSDWIPAMTDIVRPLIESDAAQYAKENSITPVTCS
jgi:branched-chain amino acid transport system substrate-binding protein